MFLEPIRSAERFAANYSGEVWIKLLDYDVDGQLIYQGVNPSPTADQDAETWSIAKYTYDGDGQLTSIEYRIASSWTDRAILDWI